jgi:CBS domain-containing protein
MLEDGAFTAGDLMSVDLAVVHPETSLREAVNLMANRRVSGVPVVDADGTLVGMLSEGDLVRWHEGYSAKQAKWLDMLADGFILAPEFLEGIRSEQNKVKLIMSKGATTVTEDVAAREIASMMYAKKIKRVPVLRDGKLVGIVSRSDLVRALAIRLSEQDGSGSVGTVNVNEALRRRREGA